MRRIYIGALAVAMATTLSCARSDLLGVSTPDAITLNNLNSADGAEGLRVGAIRNFKLMTALAGLKSGVSPAYSAFCPGFVQLGNMRFHCWKKSTPVCNDVSKRGAEYAMKDAESATVISVAVIMPSLLASAYV